jgi:hypothetical protein
MRLVHACRFERVRFARLNLFNKLVTVDVFSHMCGLAAAEKGKTKDLHEELPWPAMISEAHHIEEPCAVAATFAQPAAGNAGAEAGGVLPEELLIHRGIYARLGTYAHGKWERRTANVPVEGHMELQVWFFGPGLGSS